MPLGHAVVRFGRSGFFLALAGLLLMISMHNGFVYGAKLASRRHLVLIDDSISGWKSILMFPALTGRSQEFLWPQSYVAMFWLASLTCVTVFSWWRARRPAMPAASVDPWRACGIVAGVVLAFSMAAGFLTQVRGGFEDRLMRDPIAQPVSDLR